MNPDEGNAYRSGHRARLRKRFLEGGERGLSDRELLELLLTYAIPRKDTKPLAASLLGEFGSLAGVLRQPPSMLSRVRGIGPGAAMLLSLVLRMVSRSMEPGAGTPVLQSPDRVREYLRHRMGTLRKERFHALFLDSGNRLLASEDLEFGTVDRASVHPRNLVEKVLSSNATAVILVHNHPGGRLEASREDIQLTRRLSALAENLGFTILDHLIVTDTGILSLREEGLLDFA
jgi:DNA repair protein RadC